MGRKLVPEEDSGAVPDGVIIRAFEAGRDERALHEVHEASFADHWGFRPIPYATFEAEMYGAGDGNVGILGVVPRWRGRGIAKALLRRAFAELAKRGHQEVRLEVDAQNPTGAVALYESVGMTRYRSYDIFDLGTPEADRQTSEAARHPRITSA